MFAFVNGLRVNAYLLAQMTNWFVHMTNWVNGL